MHRTTSRQLNGRGPFAIQNLETTMKLISTRRALGVALLGMAGAVHAQTSSVMVFGLIDANVGRYKGAAAGVTLADASVWRQDASGMSTSFLGFRGIED